MVSLHALLTPASRGAPFFDQPVVFHPTALTHDLPNENARLPSLKTRKMNGQMANVSAPPPSRFARQDEETEEPSRHLTTVNDCLVASLDQGRSHVCP
jgi:hypothetical protein